MSGWMECKWWYSPGQTAGDGGRGTRPGRVPDRTADWEPLELTSVSSCRRGKRGEEPHRADPEPQTGPTSGQIAQK